MVIIHRIRISTCSCDLNIRDINRSISCVDGWKIISPLIKQNSYFRVSAYIFVCLFLFYFVVVIYKKNKNTFLCFTMHSAGSTLTLRCNATPTLVQSRSGPAHMLGMTEVQ